MTFLHPTFKSLLNANLPKNFPEGAIQNSPKRLALSSIKMFFLTFNPSASTVACKTSLVGSGMSKGPAQAQTLHSGAQPR